MGLEPTTWGPAIPRHLTVALRQYRLDMLTTPESPIEQWRQFATWHLQIVLDVIEFMSGTLKKLMPGHIAIPVLLIFRYIRVGLMRFNTLPEFNT